MKYVKSLKFWTVLTIGLFLCGGAAFAADTAATLTAGDADAPPGGNVSVAITVDNGGTDFGGTAFTLTYDSTLLTFDSLEAVDPQVISDPDAEGVTEVVDSTLYYQANDDGAGTVKIAAASATAIANQTIFNAKFTVSADAVDGETTDVTVAETEIVNEAAGYPEGSDPLPVLVGMPDADGNVADTFTTTLTAATLTFASECPLKGDLDGNGSINVMDALQILLFLNKQIDQEKLEEFCTADLDANSTVNVMDALRILLFLNKQIEEL